MWPKRPYKWIEGRTLYISIPFTWNLPEVRDEILQDDMFYDKAVVGGPAVEIMPEYLNDIAHLISDMPGILQEINPKATRTTIGCPGRCRFCAVGKGLIEKGGFRELDDWPNLPVICDNNILASSKIHFDKVIDRARKLKGVDFQNLDARLLTTDHADRMAELKLSKVRLAWDHISQEKAVIKAIEILINAGISKKKIGCYVLIGYNDDPGDAFYRLQELKKLGIRPNPMRYNPLDALKRDSHVGKNWTNKELKRFMRYWSRQAWLEHVPFEEFVK